MVKSRSKISRQPVKKSKKTAARTARGGSREKSGSAEAAARAAPSKTAAKEKKRKWVYAFGGGKAQGRAGMHNLLGGKGAGLAEMAHLGLPVPPGFTITTEVCTYFHENGKTYPKNFKSQVEAALAEVGRITGKKFGDGENPLLVSVRSGARASMPGMMDTVLNLGLNDVTVAALAARSGDRRFAYDSYRRFITMYADVVLGIAHHHFEEILNEHKDRNGYTLDTDLDAADWEQLIARFRERVKEESGAPFPGAGRNLTRGHPRHARRRGNPDYAWRHDFISVPNSPVSSGSRIATLPTNTCPVEPSIVSVSPFFRVVPPAVVARGMGKPCVTGAGALRVDYRAQTMSVRKPAIGNCVQVFTR